MSEKVYYSLAAANARDGKITIVYLYDGTGVDFTFKALSADPWMQDDYVFMAVDGPSDNMRAGSPLPAIQGMLTIDEENPAPRVFNFQGMTSVVYSEVIKNLLQMIPSKYEAFEEEWRKENFKKQNPGQDVEQSANVPREFAEITGNQSWSNICKSHKACAIGILPAITTIDYENQSFLEKLEILRDVDEATGKQASPVYYGWVNATCHVSQQRLFLTEICFFTG